VFAALSLAAASLAAVPCGGRGPGCTVPVEVNGRQMPLVVDTGADLTVLTPDGARRAGLRLGRDAPYIPVRGVAGATTARLAWATVEVGGHREEGVMVAVVEELALGGGAVGLLGMTFLERFHTRMGADLALEPIDARDAETKGGRGRSWWSLRFRQVRARLDGYRALLGTAKARDREIEASIGRSASGESLENMIERLTTFMEAEHERLQNAAARAAVPHAWRR
jgi:clan AA aspartic protease (TIGR02281 family)